MDNNKVTVCQAVFRTQNLESFVLKIRISKSLVARMPCVHIACAQPFFFLEKKNEIKILLA